MDIALYYRWDVSPLIFMYVKGHGQEEEKKSIVQPKTIVYRLYWELKPIFNFYLLFWFKK